MAISVALICLIVLKDRTHTVLFTNKYTVKCLCIIEIVRAFLVKQCQSRHILRCLSVKHQLKCQFLQNYHSVI